MATSAESAVVGRAAPGKPIRSRTAAFLRSPVFGIVAVGILLVVLGLVMKRADWLTQGAIAISLAIAATGLGLALGIGGEYLLGISFIFATGAYTAAVLTSVFEWNFWPAIVVAVVVACAVGIVMSLPGLRVSNFYFGMLGFFLVFLIPSVVQMLATWTGGSNGMAVAGTPDFFGLTLNSNGMFVLAAIALTASLLLSWNVRSSPLGIHMRRMRDAPVVLATTGVTVWRVRLSVYVFSSLFAGLGGAVYSHLSGYLQPPEFTFGMTTLILASVIVGGSRSLFGPSIGVIVLYILPRLVLNIEGFADVLYGGIIVLSVLLFRGGVVLTVHDLWMKMVSRGASRTTFVADQADELTAEALERTPDKLAKLLISLRRGEPIGDHSLSIRAVRKRYGGVAALDFEDDDAVTVTTGSVHLLLGPNGSGKTTLLNTMSGLIKLDAGSILLDGQDVTRTPPAKIARLGVSRSFQGPALPDEVSPVDLFAATLAGLERVGNAHWFLSSPRANRVRRESRRLALSVAEAAGLSAAAHEPCEKLTSGQRRIVDVVLALLTRSNIVLLDEPAAGLSDPERRQLAATIRALSVEGLGFIVVEHDLDLALSLADQVTVMAAGRPIAQGSPDLIRDSPLVRDVLIGAEA